MCEEKKTCQKPEELKGKPEECSPEQISKCQARAKTILASKMAKDK